MNDDTGNPTTWYQPPAEAPPPQWPQNLQIGFEPGIWTPNSLPPRLGATEAGAPTLYYPDVLSAVASTLDDDVVQHLNDALSPVHMTITRGPAFRDGSEVTMLLGATAGEPDALQAIKHLRSLRDTSALSPAAAAAVDQLALRRLYITSLPATLITGLPARDGHAGADRAAVTLFAAPPARTDASRVPGGRRPVVAVIDSGVGEHPWFESTATDPFWLDARDLHWSGAPLGPATNETSGRSPVDGKLESHAGHGTFIAGLVRQLAPDARVLSMYAMTGSGILDETVVLHALYWLLDRVRAAPADPSQFVDIVNLSFGYYEHSAADSRYTRELQQLLGELGSLGVQVVASAGNDAMTRPVFPAAFADPAYGAVPAIGLISVGALNPDGSHARYSNVDPLWEQHWEPGTAVISTMPPFGTSPGPVPAYYDPQDLVGGFAQWSGTSFAAAAASARLARALSTTAADDDLLDVNPPAACARMRRARKAVGVDGGDEGAGPGVG